MVKLFDVPYDSRKAEGNYITHSVRLVESKLARLPLLSFDFIDIRMS
jgi:hypothetical protein